MAESSRRRPPLSLLIAVSAVGPLALNVYMPSMPGFVRVFDTDFATVQLTLTMFVIAFAPGQLLYGPLSDRFGRKPVLLGGLGLYLVGTGICLVAPTIHALILGRFVQGLGSCSGMVLARAIVRDVYPREETARVLAYVIMTMVTAPMLAPTLGAYIELWFGWRTISLLLLATGGAALVAAHGLLGETAGTLGAPPRAEELARSAVRLLARRDFHGYAFQIAFVSGVFFNFVGAAPYVMVNLMGLQPSDYALAFILVAGMFMVGNLGAGLVTVRIGADRTIRIGSLVTLLGALAQAALFAAGAFGPLTMVGAMAAMAVGHGLSQPAAFAGVVSVDPARAGTAAGVAGFLQWAVGALGSLLMGLLLADTATPMVASMLAFSFLSYAAHRAGVRG